MNTEKAPNKCGNCIQLGEASLDQDGTVRGYYCQIEQTYPDESKELHKFNPIVQLDGSCPQYHRKEGQSNG